MGANSKNQSGKSLRRFLGLRFLRPKFDYLFRSVNIRKKVVLPASILSFTILLAVASVAVFHSDTYADPAPVDSSARLEPGSMLVYTLTAMYDGKDADGNTGFGADIKSKRLVVTDTLPAGLTLDPSTAFTVGTPVKQSDGETECASGSVVEGPTYDSTTRKISYVVENLPAGCQLDVDISVTVPSDSDLTTAGVDGMIFGNIASIQDFNLANNSAPLNADGKLAKNTTLSPTITNTAPSANQGPLVASVGIAADDSSVHNITYAYDTSCEGCVIPDGAPAASTFNTTAVEGQTVAKADPPHINGYEFSGFSGTVTTTTTPTLYDTIAAMSRGTYSAGTFTYSSGDTFALSTAITTTNSGVYQYTGNHSDAASTHNIYFYRGILDSSFTDSSNYGSSGDGTLYPNYVKLDNNTCWRIVRTTGSGGVKMIYNGDYNNSTCANGSPSAVASRFNGTSDSDTKGRVVLVGYSYNSSYNNTTNSSVAQDTLFANGTDSTAKTALENWYKNTKSMNTSAYNNLFEASAGYCGDRTSNIADGTNISSYLTSSATVNFNGRNRNYQAQNPTLECAKVSRDLYTYSTASTGNKTLSVPAALLTFDEAVLAGNGFSASGSGAYSASSFLTSGSYFWLLSPCLRASSGGVFVAVVTSGGYAGSDRRVYGSFDLRPSVSLKPEMYIASGSGTATDPWTVSATKTSYTITSTTTVSASDNSFSAPAADIALTGSWKAVSDANKNTVTYEITGTDGEGNVVMPEEYKAPGASVSADGATGTTKYAEGDTVATDTTAAGAVIDGFEFSGWSASGIPTMPAPATSMQDFSCSSLSSGDTTTLVDTREGGVNSYIVGKLADDNCWMLQNLRLGSTATSASDTISLSASDSDVNSFTLTGYTDAFSTDDGSTNEM